MGVSRVQWEEMRRLGNEALSSAHDLSEYISSLEPDEVVQRFPGDPGEGKIIYGASVQGGRPEPLESLTGRKLGVFRSYHDDDEVVDLVARVSADVTDGRVPLASIKTPGGDWAAVGNGNQDAWLDSILEPLSQLTGPVWLCLHHEPSGQGTPANYAAMYEQARRRRDAAGAANVALVQILNGWSFLDPKGNKGESWRTEPGTGPDLVGFDSYNPWSPVNSKKWNPVEHVFSPGLTIQSWGYDTFVGEYGVRQDDTDPSKASTWLLDAYNFCLSSGFVLMSYFHSGQNSPDGTWQLDGPRLQAFITNLNVQTSA